MGLDQNILLITGSGEADLVEVAYFRKVNFLHHWVEEHLNGGEETNCDSIPFSLEAMAGLAQTCRQVLADPTRGPGLLPTQAGFFFGPTDYDDGYLMDVREVLGVLTKILTEEAAKKPPGSGRYVYYSWW